MNKSKRVAYLFAGLIGFFSPAISADAGDAWNQLMVLMFRAFANLTDQANWQSPGNWRLGDSRLSSIYVNPRALPAPTVAPPLPGVWSHPWDAGRSRWSGLPLGSRSATGPLDGVWETESGAILMVRDGRARVYLSRDRFQDFELRLEGRILALRDRDFGAIRRYLYTADGDRMLMLDPEGSLLLLRRVPG